MKYETSTLRRGIARLREALPPGWTVDLDRTSPTAVDARLVVRAPDSNTAVLAVRTRRRLPPGGLPQLRESLGREPDARPIVVAGWLSPLTRRALVEAGIGFVDLTGNLDLRLDRPGLFLRDLGADRDPEPRSAALKSLKGDGAGRAVRALVDFVPPYGVRQLAAVSGASAAVMTRVLQLLDEEELVTREREVTGVDWEGVLRRWVTDTSFGATSRVVPCLEPRGSAALLRKLAADATIGTMTGTAAVPDEARVVPVGLVAMYVRSAEEAVEALGLTPTQTGANVLLLETDDPGPLARAKRGADGIVRCAPSQVYADLATGPGRGSAEAEALLGWMRANESSWRRRP